LSLGLSLPPRPMMCPARVRFISFHLLFMHLHVQRRHIGSWLQHCRIQIQRWHLAGLPGHPCHPRVPSLATARGHPLAQALQLRSLFFQKWPEEETFSLPPCLGLVFLQRSIIKATGKCQEQLVKGWC